MEIKSNSVIQKDNKSISFYNSSVLVNNNMKSESIFSLCDLNIPYESISVSNLTLLPQSPEIKLIPDTMSGSGVTSVIIKIKYVGGNCTCNCSKGFINYRLEGYPLSDRKIGEIMVLTGTDEKRIPQIYLYNDSEFTAKIETMIGSTLPVQSEIRDEISFSGLSYNNILTDITEFGNFSGSTLFNVIDYTGSTLLAIDFNKIDIININENEITIITDSFTKIKLIFIDRYNTEQCLSRMNWVREQSYNRYITKTQPPLDNTPPEIVFKLTGSTLSIQNTPNITKDDIIFYFIETITDYDDNGEIRDGIINNGNIDIKIINKSNGNIIDNITGFGEYSITFSVSDIAGNRNKIIKNLISIE